MANDSEPDLQKYTILEFQYLLRVAKALEPALERRSKRD
jgi:hypothetical protein